MRKGNCGCRFCRKESIPMTRGAWKGLKNKSGHSYGTNGKPTKRVKVRKQ